MDSRLLQHMYQAWIQGNTEHVNDWHIFADWAATFNNKSVEEVLELLKNCPWANIKGIKNGSRN